MYFIPFETVFRESWAAQSLSWEIFQANDKNVHFPFTTVYSDSIGIITAIISRGRERRDFPGHHLHFRYSEIRVTLKPGRRIPARDRHAAQREEEGAYE